MPKFPEVECDGRNVGVKICEERPGRQSFLMVNEREEEEGIVYDYQEEHRDTEVKRRRMGMGDSGGTDGDSEQGVSIGRSHHPLRGWETLQTIYEGDVFHSLSSDRLVPHTCLLEQHQHSTTV